METDVSSKTCFVYRIPSIPQYILGCQNPVACTKQFYSSKNEGLEASHNFISIDNFIWRCTVK